eukprot:CAMPEP_0113688928 /NCGR_PEP_ID=MMETSP0038_2-20120614/16839_1 /TAXON_ID=2898 /ORGANISM="Cryptomonas paramecium" /LENGTH=123 /DNA_ID=CAMNT_0000609859 /DNA_START=91 /DNA_END=459 /DNA_ORIENTATION=+ /assembly_acc=CAM_ASM_000170
MASVRSLVTAANATVGPMAAQRRPEETKMAVVPSAEETITISQMDQILFDWFGKDSWIIPGGVIMTGVVLMSGLVSLKNNNKQQQQAFMRLRVGTQGATIMAMMMSLMVQERQNTLACTADKR